MPNTSFLLDRLNTAPLTSVSVQSPRRLTLDDHGYLVTVSYSTKSIVRFSPNNLTRIDLPASPVFTENPFTVAYRNGAYYVGFNYWILVVQSSDMTLLYNISTPALHGARDIIFLDEGQLMIVISNSNNRLLFFNRSSAGSFNYNFTVYQNVLCRNPQGLFYVNDGFFYAIAWSNGTVYAYADTGNTTSWLEKLVFSSGAILAAPNGNNVAIDEAGRFWLSLGSYGLQLFHSQGSALGTLQPAGSSAFDILILDNYVIYFSDSASNRIYRIDPNITC